MLQRIPALLASFLVLGATRLAAAQTATGFAAADSASIARTAWVRAAAELRRGDTAAARRNVARAATAWPVQPAYVWASAILAARAGNDDEALAALRRYADLGLGRALGAEPSFARLRDLPAFAALRSAHDSNRRPVARGRPVATLADSTFWPEGMDVDPLTSRIFVASVRHRTIAVVEPNGSSHELWPRDEDDLGAVLGVRFDAARDVLWATTSPVRQAPGFAHGDTVRASLLRVRLSDGSLERRWDLPRAPDGHTLGDLAIGPRGDVFVTDSDDPVLYRLRPGADTLESMRHPLFHSLQGLAPSPDGRWLILADYSHGLLRVDLARGEVIRLDDAPRSTSLGCDGIAWDRGAIVAVQNGVAPARVMRFVLDTTVSRITTAQVIDQNTEVADEPTIGAIVGGRFVYVANSQWSKFDGAGRRMTARPLTAPVLLAVRLP